MSSGEDGITFSGVLVPIRQADYTMSEVLHFIFKVDFWLIIIPALLFCYVAVWDLNELGMTKIEVGSGLRIIGICTLALGPGAALSMTCIWREDRMRTAALEQDKKAR